MYAGRGNGYGGYGGYGGGRSPDSPFWRSLMMLANVLAAFASYILGELLYIKTEAAMSALLISIHGDDAVGLWIAWCFSYVIVFVVARMSIIALFAILMMASMRLAFSMGVFAF